MSEPIGIVFSYQDGENHVFGYGFIPEKYTLEEATKMVNEKKARFIYDKGEVLGPDD